MLMGTTLDSRSVPLRGSSTALQMSRCDDYAEYLRKNPDRWGGPIIGPIIRYINIFIVGLLGRFLLAVLCRFKRIRLETLLHLVWNRPKGKPLLTISNHQSVFDDPGLWGALLPFWLFRPNQMRWNLCTEDIFFGAGPLKYSFGAGNVIPLDRSGSLEQPCFRRFQEKLASGSWCHLFPEGRVWQNWRFDQGEDRLGPFKHGIGKLIAHCGDTPIVLPMYHTGMDKFIPEKVISSKKKGSKPAALIPKVGHEIQFFVGEPIDFTEKIAKFKSMHPGKLEKWETTSEGLALYEEIANECRQGVLKLAREAWSTTIDASTKTASDDERNRLTLA